MLPGNRAPGYSQRHHTIIVLPRSRPVAHQSGRQALRLIANQLAHQYWIIKNANVVAFESQGQSLDGLCLTCISRREWLDAQAIARELLDNGLSDAVLFRDGLSRSP